MNPVRHPAAGAGRGAARGWSARGRPGARALAVLAAGVVLAGAGWRLADATGDAGVALALAPAAAGPGTPPGERSLAEHLGRSFFELPWVPAPASTTLRDGLGPLYNAHACSSCHQGATFGPPHAGGGGPAVAPPVGLSLRIGRRDGAGFVPDPDYGQVLQRRAIPAIAVAGVPGEARWRLEHVVADDGRGLLRPVPRIEAFASGDPAPGLLVSLRRAPAIAGIGQLERIADATLLALEDPDDRDGDGISGRAHRLPAVAGEPDRRVGRYGYKAVHATLAAQVAAALSEDLGISSRLAPAGPCAANQAACRAAPDGAGPDGPHEIPDPVFAALVAHVAALPAVPGPDAGSTAGAGGERLFEASGCAACHVPGLPAVDGGTVTLYSDLLLHDMGPGLADPLGQGAATGSEWRTAPLAGLGARARHGHAGLLHDGRAANLVDAILGHGGEAASARARFEALDAAQRATLLAWLHAL